MKILIIEDERPAAEMLKRIVLSEVPEGEVVAILQSNHQLKEWVRNNPWPDLILSDIELLDGTVFNSFKAMRPEAPIIFTTAYDHFMAEAFETSGISYLLKPVKKDDLKRALSKLALLKPTQNAERSFHMLLDKLEELSHQNKSYKTRITVKKPNGLVLLTTNAMTCLILKNGVLHVYDKDGQLHILTQGLGELMTELDPSKFLQINRSEAVAVDHIDRIEAYGRDRLAIYIKKYPNPLITSISKTPEVRKWLVE
jgi:DNA-binding LytR/AlgR family response regulator